MISRSVSSGVGGRFCSDLDRRGCGRVSTCLVRLLDARRGGTVVVNDVCGTELVGEVGGGRVLELYSIMTETFLPSLGDLPSCLRRGAGVSVRTRSVVGLKLVSGFLNNR